MLWKLKIQCEGDDFTIWTNLIIFKIQKPPQSPFEKGEVI